jgi:glycosyltransferase involved in cell wall biosynthesis
MRVALVHDWLVTMGGAERVLEELAHLYPEAPIYAGVIRKEALSPFLQSRRLIPSLVQHWPRATRWYNRYLPLLAYGVEQWDLSSYDVVISSSAAVAKGVVTPAETFHLSYVHTPMRYAWDLYHAYHQQEATGVTRRIMGPVFHYMRLWDRLSADRADQLVANSTIVARRIQKHYGRSSVIVAPPVDIDGFSVKAGAGAHYLVLSRLVRYKRFDLAVEAANRLRIPLVVAGDGPDRARLQGMAGPTVKFLGRVDEATRVSLIEGAKALIFPGEEDFGIVPVEVQAAGRPVIGYGRGGVLDTVVAGETGILFEEQTVDAVVEAIQESERQSWDRARIRVQSERFRPEYFRESIAALVARGVQEGRSLQQPTIKVGSAPQAPFDEHESHEELS